MNLKLYRKAFLLTLPVLAGYLALGIACGVLFSKLQLPIFWMPVMSLTIYGGSMQFAGAMMLQQHLALWNILFLSIMINIRHVVYGLPLLEAFNRAGWRKYYLIFALTDETYALFTSMEITEDADQGKFMFTVAALNQTYWILGGLIGAIAGSMLKFDYRGIEFSMTSIFVAILTDLCREKHNWIPIIIGGICTSLFGMFLSTDWLLPPALLAVIVILLCLRKKLSAKHPFLGAE